MGILQRSWKSGGGLPEDSGPRLTKKLEGGVPSHRKHRTPTRRAYFILTSLLGFLLGWSALAVGLKLSGERASFVCMGTLVCTVLLLGCSILAAWLLHESYRSFSRKQR